MLKPIRWNTFIKDFLRIQVGFFLFGLAITLMIRGNIGTSAWAVLEVALAQKIGISIGTMTVLMGFFVLTGAVLMREKWAGARWQIFCPWRISAFDCSIGEDICLCRSACYCWLSFDGPPARFTQRGWAQARARHDAGDQTHHGHQYPRGACDH